MEAFYEYALQIGMQGDTAKRANIHFRDLLIFLIRIKFHNFFFVYEKPEIGGNLLN